MLGITESGLPEPNLGRRRYDRELEERKPTVLHDSIIQEEENKMLRKLMVYAVPAIALILVAGFTIRTAFATPAVVPFVDRGYDEVERIRGQFPLSVTADRSYDEVERNRSNYRGATSADRSYEEVERNRSNYLLTSPAAGSNGGSNLWDYALRHPELTKPAAPDLSDWFLRHRGEAFK